MTKGGKKKREANQETDSNYRKPTDGYQRGTRRSGGMGEIGDGD